MILSPPSFSKTQLAPSMIKLIGFLTAFIADLNIDSKASFTAPAPSLIPPAIFPGKAFIQSTTVEIPPENVFLIVDHMDFITLTKEFFKLPIDDIKLEAQPLIALQVFDIPPENNDFMLFHKFLIKLMKEFFNPPTRLKVLEIQLTTDDPTPLIPC